MSKAMLNMLVFLPEINRKGSKQSELMQLAKDYPISGVEIRREYLPETANERRMEISAIMQQGIDYEWTLFYSVPEPLFVEGGLNPQLNLYIEEALSMSITRMKLNIGLLSEITEEKKGQLIDVLEGRHLQLTVENDQTTANGPLRIVREALKKISDLSVPVHYTFDTGNWCWHDDNPLEAAELLQSYVTDLHIKNVTDKQTTMIEDGEIDWKKVMSIIRDVPVVMEYPTKTEGIVSELEKINKQIELLKTKKGDV